MTKKVEEVKVQDQTFTINADPGDRGWDCGTPFVNDPEWRAAHPELKAETITDTAAFGKADFVSVPSCRTYDLTGLKDGGTRKTYSTGAQKEDDSKTEGKGAYHLLPVLAQRRVAEIFRKGGIKYDEWNWQLGLPLSRFFDSGSRHKDQEWEGLIDEDHIAQACWNFLCYLQTLIMIERGLLPPSLDDRPSYGLPGDRDYRPAGAGFGLAKELKGQWGVTEMEKKKAKNG